MTVTLQEIVSKTPASILRANSSFCWANGKILVADDPNLIDYFGDYVLRNILLEKEIYCLESKNNCLNIVNFGYSQNIKEGRDY